MNDEEKLLSALKAKKRGSLEKTIDIYTPYVSVIVYNIIGGIMTKEDVEETVSDVFVSLWRSAQSLDGEKGSLRAYLGTIARNAARKKLRSSSVNVSLDENITSLCGNPDTETESKEETAMLLELIKDLGEPDAEIFLRRYWYGEKTSKISAATGICKSTVTTKLHRGRKKLREILSKEGAK